MTLAPFLDIDEIIRQMSQIVTNNGDPLDLSLEADLDRPVIDLFGEESSEETPVIGVQGTVEAPAPTETLQGVDLTTFEEQEPGSAAAFRAFESATQTSTDWFDQANGRISQRRLREVPGLGYYEPNAAKAMKAMKRAAARDGIQLTGGGYRSYAEQEALQYKEALGIPVAEPGHSNHGWGTAVDMNLGDPRVFQWLNKNAGRFGWENPEWAQNGVEPWHWEYNGKAVKGQDFEWMDKLKKRGRRKSAKPKSGAQDVDLVTPASPLVSFTQAVWGVLNDEPQAAERIRQRVSDPSTPTNIPGPRNLRKYFQQSAKRSGVDVLLLLAVGAIETGGGSVKNIHNPEGANSAGAVGPMQVIPKWHPGLKDPHDPQQNIIYAGQHLAGLIEWAGGDVRKALAAYNGGSNNWEAGLGYASMVLDVYRALRKRY